jgi:AAA domain
MKIDALRLAAFRRFSDPKSIEDFADGVNVLAGPNEMGKSTFFQALEAAFVVRHKVTGAALDAMRPFSGGEPLVEADFSNGEQKWRIRKQFGRGNTAILTDLTSARVLARNAEAEEQLAGLIGRSGDTPGPLGLVWVHQQRALHAPDPDFDAVKGKERPRGERNALQDAIGREVETAAGGEMLNRIQTLTSEALDVYLTPTRNAAKKNGPLDVARRDRDEALANLAVADRAAQTSEQRLQAIAAAMAELAVVVAPEQAQSRDNELIRLEAQLATEVNRRAQFDLSREALNARTSEVSNARQTIDAIRARAERLVALTEQRAGAVTLESQIAELALTINSNHATPGRIERLTALERERDIASAELSATTARVDIALQPGGAGRVSLDGAVVADDITHEVLGRSTIAIDGIATLTVSSPGAEGAARARQRRENAEAELAQILNAIGASTTSDARQKAEARARAVEDLDRARAKLSGIAPGGSAALVNEIEKLAQAGATSPDLITLEADLQSREAAAHAARKTFDELKASALGDDGFRQLTAQYEKAKRENADAAQAVARLSMQVERLKSEQAGADEDGRAGQVTALKGECERHELEVKRIESEAKALLLLSRTLEASEARARDALFEPITRRLRPHLARVFGVSDVGFKDAFAIDGLTRGGLREEFSVLSDGTREQLSVLVRLAFAELLASRGVPVPLVLDDPLVYSDDERLSKVCGVLQSAAQQLQIIILTCRPTAFQTLSGHRVSVNTWQPEG